VDLSIAWHYLPYLLSASVVTIEVSALSLFFSTLLGLAIAFLRLYGSAGLRVAAWLYVWLVRGTPLLLQIFMVYYWLPGLGIRLPAFEAGVLTLSLNSASYFADIFRAAIAELPTGKAEAAYAIGMRPWQALRRIILPLAVRPALPPYIGHAIGLVKGSALVSVISVQELTFTSQEIYSSTYRVPEILGTAGLIYLAMTTVLQLFQTWLEKRLSYYTVR